MWRWRKRVRWRRKRRRRRQEDRCDVSSGDNAAWTGTYNARGQGSRRRRGEQKILPEALEFYRDVPDLSESSKTFSGFPEFCMTFQNSLRFQNFGGTFSTALSLLRSVL